MLPPGPTPFIMCGDANPSVVRRVVRRVDAEELELAVTTAYLGGRVSEALADTDPTMPDELAVPPLPLPTR
mgnify:CR=1 FL=1